MWNGVKMTIVDIGHRCHVIVVLEEKLESLWADEPFLYVS